MAILHENSTFPPAHVTFVFSSIYLIFVYLYPFERWKKPFSHASNAVWPISKTVRFPDQIVEYPAALYAPSRKSFSSQAFSFFVWMTHDTTRQNQLNPFLSALNQIRFSSVSVFFCLLCSLSEISVCYPWLSFITCFVHAAHIHTQYSTIYFIRI